MNVKGKFVKGKYVYKGKTADLSIWEGRPHADIYLHNGIADISAVDMDTLIFIVENVIEEDLCDEDDEEELEYEEDCGIDFYAEEDEEPIEEE